MQARLWADVIRLPGGFSLQQAHELAPTQALGRVLQPLAVRIFGHEQTRQPQWLTRKCQREGVDAALSIVLQSTEGPAGYFLIGRRPNQSNEGFTAGLGVVPEVRKRGFGTALVRAGIEVATAAGLDALVLPAPTERVTWYQKHGFHEIRCTHTWLNFASGRVPTRPEYDAPWGGPSPRQLCAWAADIWQRMPSEQRHRYNLVDTIQANQIGWALCSPEGRAVLCHRLVASATGPIETLLAGLLAGIPAGTPVLLHEVDQVSSFTEVLKQSGWDPVQTIHTLRRDLKPPSCT